MDRGKKMGKLWRLLYAPTAKAALVSSFFLKLVTDKVACSDEGVGKLLCSAIPLGRMEGRLSCCNDNMIACI